MPDTGHLVRDSIKHSNATNQKLTVYYWSLLDEIIYFKVDIHYTDNLYIFN